MTTVGCKPTRLPGTWACARTEVTSPFPVTLCVWGSSVLFGTLEVNVIVGPVSGCLFMIFSFLNVRLPEEVATGSLENITLRRGEKKGGSREKCVAQNNQLKKREKKRKKTLLCVSVKML